MIYDWLIIGAGIYGATFAREMTDAGLRCLVVEQRPYAGGNCADEWRNGILVNLHGGHIFHTNDADTWRYVNRFAEFWPYRHKVKAKHEGQVYSLPFNLTTFAQVYGICTPERVQEFVDGLAAPEADNLREWAISQVGLKMYLTLIDGYTRKQWGRDPSELPASIIKRIPIRPTFNDDYFTDTYQGLPVGGYSAMILRMLDGIDIMYGVDYLTNRAAFDGTVANILYTGAIDDLFGCDEGELEYRGLRWELQEVEGDFQGCATVNYTAADVPYTRILEYKHFMPTPPEKYSIIGREFPSDRGGRYYPVNTEQNNRLAAMYRLRAQQAGIHTGGRLGEYRYYDMHQAIAAARVKAGRWLNGIS